MKDLKLSTPRLIQNLAAVLVFALIILMACGVLPVEPGTWSFLGRNKEALTIHYITPDGEITREARRGTVVTLEPGEEIENYTFIGWRDPQGNIEKRESFKIYQNSYYSAVYAVALQTNTHKAYLFPNRYGMYLPYSEMTRGDSHQRKRWFF